MYSRAIIDIFQISYCLNCFQDTIDENNGDLDVDYNTLNNMVYMGKVIKETIRLWGINFFDRTCTKDYYIPEINYTVPKGIFIKLRGCLHRTLSG